jgi:hypothetical protein
MADGWRVAAIYRLPGCWTRQASRLLRRSLPEAAWAAGAELLRARPCNRRPAARAPTPPPCHGSTKRCTPTPTSVSTSCSHAVRRGLCSPCTPGYALLAAGLRASATRQGAVRRRLGAAGAHRAAQPRGPWWRPRPMALAGTQAHGPGGSPQRLGHAPVMSRAARAARIASRRAPLPGCAAVARARAHSCAAAAPRRTVAAHAPLTSRACASRALLAGALHAELSCGRRLGRCGLGRMQLAAARPD